MSKSSEYVKQWRKKVKEIILTCMGGECQNCGYHRCPTALEMHHVDPESKDFSFSYILASCRSWKVIYEEMSKCILLCVICHREFHAGLIELPETYTRFDPTLADSLRSKASLMTSGNRPETSKAKKLENQQRASKSAKAYQHRRMYKDIDNNSLTG